MESSMLNFHITKLKVSCLRMREDQGSQTKPV